MKRLSFSIIALIFGYAFLYIPLFSLIAQSFNESQLATNWGGFSLKWYAELFNNRQVIEALWLSVRIAIISATFAMLLGTCAGMALARFRKFRGRGLFSGMVAAPLVMPEVITGLSLLVLFIAMEELLGWPAGRGESTITIAHITFSMAFVAVIIQGRLAGQEDSLEEAAQDLGARPLRVLVDITLPLLAPGMLAGWQWGRKIVYPEGSGVIAIYWADLINRIELAGLQCLSKRHAGSGSNESSTLL
jgi:putrescine transport system permease protein